MTLIALFRLFLRFGCLAFGGPVAQIAMIRHALVDEQRWISPARFNRLLAVMQALPGPEAHELCVHLGMIARGRIGGLLAGLGFMLPGFVLMLAAAWGYDRWIVGNTAAVAAMVGVQVAVLAVILRAVQRIGTHAIEDGAHAMIAAAAFIATVLQAGFWIVLIAAGLIGLLERRPRAIAAVVIVAVVIGWLTHATGISPILPGAGAAPPATGAVAGAATAVNAGHIAMAAATGFGLFIAGLKGGLLTFGGAYTAIPYVRADTVGRGWISDASFLDGVAIAGTLPAPLVIFATFAGYVAGGWSGALAITAGMFLPAFAFSLILYERLEAVVENPALHRALGAVTAAVIGIIAATWLQLAMATAMRAPGAGPAAAIFTAAAIAMWSMIGRYVAPLVVLGGALAGWLFWQ